MSEMSICVLKDFKMNFETLWQLNNLMTPFILMNYHGKEIVFKKETDLVCLLGIYYLRKITSMHKLMFDIFSSLKFRIS